MSDVIRLDAWEMPCILGVLESEQRIPQPLRIEVAMELDLEAAAGGDLTASVDYASVRDQVTFMVQHGRFRLLESIAFGIVRLLLCPPAPGERRAPLEAVEVGLSKPTILDDAIPGVRVRRAAAWCSPETHMLQEGVWAEVLVKTPRSAAHRVILQPGARWRVPPHVSWLGVAGEGSTDSGPVRSGVAFGPSQIAEVEATEAEIALLVVGLREE